ncbi:MAG: zinc ribbon domain-containing protein [Planctomycetota bacterium]|nr:zinc ribbon domain-containing protein [Planctomycetota bacterium]
MRCPSCSRPLPEGAKFCDSCGHKLQHATVLLCPVCKLENDSDNSYCIFCGSLLKRASGPQAIAPSETSAISVPQSVPAAQQTNRVTSALKPSYSFIYILLALLLTGAASVGLAVHFIGKEERAMLRTTRNVFQEMKAFLNDVDYFRFHNLNFYWEDGYGKYSSYRNDEYLFIYISNDTDRDGVHRATKFVFLAVPLTTSPSRTAYFTDESYVIYQADISPFKAAKLRSLSSSDVDWTIPSNTIRPSRCDLEGVEFSVFNRDVYAHE